MFYSRPPIKPFGWDLLGLPTPNGSRNFDAMTADGHPVDFRFSSGWLTVERGEAGASPESEMEEILSLPIAPFGVVDIYPEQLCDILGLTVQGREVSAAALNAQARGFDWSGRTTYWHSTHSMRLRDDAELLTAQIAGAFPDAVLLQLVWRSDPWRVRCRQIKFMMEFDPLVYIGIGCDPERLQRMLAAEEVPVEEFDSLIARRIELNRTSEYADLSGSQHIKSRGADRLDLDYDVIHHRRYRIRTEYATDDLRGQEIMKELLAIIDGHFCRGLQIVRLQTGEVVAEDRDDEEDSKSYSRPFREWCLERSNRYLSVDVCNAPGSESFEFVGYRPVVRP